MARVKLTDKQKQKIIADYVETQNYCETARINKTDESTVRRIVKSQDNAEIKRKTEQKKEENTKDILKYMDEIYDKQKSIIDLSLSALEEKLKKPDMFTNVRDIAMVYGVIFDKALKYKEIQRANGNTEEINKVKELLEKIEKEAGK